MVTPNPKAPLILSGPSIAATAVSSFPDPHTSGSVTWKTLISAPQTASDSLTVGIATCAPGSAAGCRGDLKPHRHAQAEVYHVVQGRGVITIDGKGYAVEKGSVVWIPGDAEHGIVNEGEEELVWVYVFAVDGFEDIVYRFDKPGAGTRERAKL
ncbi:RmlC-like cupin domain-containing protein [Boeremia exigua]|uniref:RmlC-like cupin domain-containing protein n=1 Tax=Boeremia exigua TaxID=749465 RepID=UPI001E8D0D64|nr:RmlC-like cupin domain-containing protein [Boeremia exigua]KAH6622245.1 RmlC-like cupin domain-containing protein [Boeremia exigua]